MTKIRKRTLCGAVVGLVLVLGAGALILILQSGFFDSPTAEETPLLRQGMALHAAIWEYEAKHSKLPTHLNDLVPDCLKSADLNAPPPHSGGPIFKLVAPNRPATSRRTNADLLVSSPIKSANSEGTRVVYVQEDGDVGVRAIE